MLLLAEAAELISGNNQAYSVQPDIAGKSGPFISGGRAWLVFKKGKCNKNNVFQCPTTTTTTTTTVTPCEEYAYVC